MERNGGGILYIYVPSSGKRSREELRKPSVRVRFMTSENLTWDFHDMEMSQFV
jgi:hypothetical protein